jgi:serine/threonine protein kinase
MNWDSVVQMAFEIASGVAALHSFDPPVVHRDLKSGNILVFILLTPLLVQYLMH